MAKKALISVSDKSNLEKLLPALSGYEIISTGGTAKYIRDKGFTVQEVAELTSFPEMLGGRVKTLHPNVLGGILARTDHEADLTDLKTHNIDQINIVVVNLYPFADVIKSENLVYADAIENIDIGGPTLLRSAAKNYASTVVLSNPNQYEDFISVLKEHGMESKEMLQLKERLAYAVFELTNDYDKLIAKFLKKRYEEFNQIDTASALPQTLNLNLELKSKLRYGENPHQNAGLYVAVSEPLSGFSAARQLNGKEISFNNLLDLNAAYNIVSEYEASIPCVAIVKHNNPCGVAIAPSVAQAYLEALGCDMISAFGGIVATNNIVDLASANEMVQIFLEAIVAPGFSQEAIAILKSKPNLRLIEMPSSAITAKAFDIKTIQGGYLVQDKDDTLHNPEELKVVTKKQIEEHQWVDLMLAWKIVKHVKSNAIVAVLNGKTIGIGCGQMNRVKSVMDALSNSDIDSRGAVLASDAFFPFADNIHIAAQNNIAAIIQPGGSIRDQEVIEACDQAGIAMVFTYTRHFKH